MFDSLCLLAVAWWCPVPSLAQQSRRPRRRCPRRRNNRHRATRVSMPQRAPTAFRASFLKKTSPACTARLSQQRCVCSLNFLCSNKQCRWCVATGHCQDAQRGCTGTQASVNPFARLACSAGSASQLHTPSGDEALAIILIVCGAAACFGSLRFARACLVANRCLQVCCCCWRWWHSKLGPTSCRHRPSARVRFSTPFQRF